MYRLPEGEEFAFVSGGFANSVKLFLNKISLHCLFVAKKQYYIHHSSRYLPFHILYFFIKELQLKIPGATGVKCALCAWN